jgi:shikimate kinase
MGETKMTKKIILISGMSTAGKSTISYALAKKLPSWVFIDIWRIKDIFEPLGLKKRDDIISISKKAVIMLTKEVIEKMGRNIILQEAKTDFIKRNLGKELKKHGYKVYSFCLTVPLKHAAKRDIKREKPTMGIGKDWTEERWKEKIKKLIQKDDVSIDTSKFTKKQVVDIILKKVREKPKKHPRSKMVRRFW